MRRISLALAVAVLATLPVVPSSAESHVTWLCHPDRDPNPCVGDQTTRYFEPDGSSTVATPDVPADPPVDCFYVYPTVSNQPLPNALPTTDPEIRSIAVYQAQRFSTACRVFAPVYRQVTIAGLTIAGRLGEMSWFETAYADVREAFLEYLARDNDGRGFVLVGHSQGTRMLRALIRREIDLEPDVRARLVSAILAGGNVTVPAGQLAGGDFENIPACEHGAQTGCVVAFSTFNETPPDNSRYGRIDNDPLSGVLDLPTGPGLEVMCTDPAALAGSARLETLLPSEPFAPGVIFLLMLQMYRGLPPSADTPWLQPQDHYTAGCVWANGAHVLMTEPVGGARRLSPAPDASWGLHLVDVNIALGNLTAIVGLQADAWLGA